MMTDNLSDETRMHDAPEYQIETLTKELTKLSIERTRKLSQYTLLQRLNSKNLTNNTLNSLLTNLTMNENVQPGSIDDFKTKAMEDKIKHTKTEVENINRAITATTKNLIYRIKGDPDKTR